MSLRRIATFLELDENTVGLTGEGDANSLHSLYQENTSTTDAVLVEDASFSWGSDTPVLNKLVPLITRCINM